MLRKGLEPGRRSSGTRQAKKPLQRSKLAMLRCEIKKRAAGITVQLKAAQSPATRAWRRWHAVLRKAWRAVRPGRASGTPLPAGRPGGRGGPGGLHGARPLLVRPGVNNWPGPCLRLDTQAWSTWPFTARPAEKSDWRLLACTFPSAARRLKLINDAF